MTADDRTDLADNPARAALAFSTENGPECVPAVVRSTGHIEVGVDCATFGGLDLHDRATLLLDDALVTQVIRNSFVMRLATMSAAGHTPVTPLWFVVDGGRLVAGTAASTVAVRNVRADPRITVVVNGERAGKSDLVLRLAGVAEAHEGMPPRSAIVRLAAKYYLSAGGLQCELRNSRRWRLRQRYYQQAEAVWINIEPTSAEFLTLPSAR